MNPQAPRPGAAPDSMPSARPRARRIHPVIARIGASRPFLRLAPRWLPALDLLGHRLTQGRWLPSRLFLPTVLLTTTGHRTGRSHTVPLCAASLPDGGWLVVATNFGRPCHPAWSTNLLHHPNAAIHWHGYTYPVTARLLTGAERTEARPLVLAILPVYDRYAATAANRDIRILRLDPPRNRDEHPPPLANQPPHEQPATPP